MRLICPNCDAEYEVDDAAIPRSGRDVQCSSCGHAWFQSHPEVTAEAEEEAALFGEPASEDALDTDLAPDLEPEDLLDAEAIADLTPVNAPEPDVVPDVGPDFAPESEPVAAPAVMPAPSAEPALRQALAQGLGPVPSPSAFAPEMGAEAEPNPAPEAPLDLPRRSIDESVLAVLREEAEREAAARRGERPRIETQTEMTLPEAPRAAVSAPLRDDPVIPPAPQTAAPPVVEAPRKRSLLPEIEEIKSSLHPSMEAETDESPMQAPQGGGFRTGFVFAVLIAVILMALYVMAPMIAAKVPALSGALEVYVRTVNGLRVTLDQRMRALIGWLQGLAGGSAG